MFSIASYLFSTPRSSRCTLCKIVICTSPFKSILTPYGVKIFRNKQSSPYSHCKNSFVLVFVTFSNEIVHFLLINLPKFILAEIYFNFVDGAASLRIFPIISKSYIQNIRNNVMNFRGRFSKFYDFFLNKINAQNAP